MPDNSDTNKAARDTEKEDNKRALGSSLKDLGRQANERSEAIAQSIRPVAYKKGGKVRKKSRKAKGRRKSR